MKRRREGERESGEGEMLDVLPRLSAMGYF